MGQSYEPEMGQAIFGCPTSAYSCPEFVEAGLGHLAEEIERVEWNRTQQAYDAPTGNNGGAYSTTVFSMNAYYWGDCECDGDQHDPGCLAALANFKCGDFEVRWYKYLGRGMSMNQDIDANRFFELIGKCLESVRSLDVTN